MKNEINFWKNYKTILILISIFLLGVIIMELLNLNDSKNNEIVSGKANHKSYIPWIIMTIIIAILFFLQSKFYNLKRKDRIFKTSNRTFIINLLAIAFILPIALFWDGLFNHSDIIISVDISFLKKQGGSNPFIQWIKLLIENNIPLVIGGIFTIIGVILFLNDFRRTTI